MNPNWRRTPCFSNGLLGRGQGERYHNINESFLVKGGTLKARNLC